MRRYLLLAAVVLTGLPSAVAASGFTWDESATPGALLLADEGRPVLAYVYEGRLREGVHERFRRACYVHPIYDLSGHPMTDDFPADHFHHRGMWWSWPRMRVRGQDVQTWHPSPLRQRFVKWLQRDLGEDRAVLAAQNEWVLDGTRVGLETVTLTVSRAAGGRRNIEVALTLEAVDEPIQVLGAADKGYGGLAIRLDPSFTGGAMTTDQGPLPADSTLTPFAWAELSAGGRGLTVRVGEDHPDAPIGWLLRNSYAGILNPAWPGLTPATLDPGVPVTLTYQLTVHQPLTDSDPAPAPAPH